MTKKQFEKFLKKEKHPIIYNNLYIYWLYMLIMAISITCVSLIYDSIEYITLLIYFICIIIFIYITLVIFIISNYKFDKMYQHYQKNHEILKVKDHKKVLILLIKISIFIGILLILYSIIIKKGA